VPEAKQPSRRGRARGRATERAPRQRGAAAGGQEGPKRRAAEEAARAPRIREELAARGLLIKSAYTAAPPEMAEAVVTPAPVVSPVSAMVDRRDIPDVFSIDTRIVSKEGELLAILRREFGYPAGRLPGDPGRFPSTVDPRLAVCHMLSPVAAARCLGGGRYFR
jgi:hypothetical protein